MTIEITLLILGLVLLIAIVVLIWLVSKIINTQKINMKITTKKQDLTTPTIKLKNKPSTPKSKYIHSKLSKEDKEQYLEMVINYLEKEKVYRQANLTIGELAQKIDIPKHHLSQVINEKMNCSFLDFINQYRVAEAKEYLETNDLSQLTIVEIRRKVGFNAKSTFYAAFKKYTNCTPGDYRKPILKSPQ